MKKKLAPHRTRYAIEAKEKLAQTNAANEAAAAAAKAQAAYNSPEAVAERERNFLKTLDGARFVRTNQPVMSDSRGDHVYEVRGNTLYWGGVIRQAGSFDRKWNQTAYQLRLNPQNELVYQGGLRWEKPRDLVCTDFFSSWTTCKASTFQISSDGTTLTGNWFNYSTRAPDSATYYRSY